MTRRAARLLLAACLLAAPFAAARAQEAPATLLAAGDIAWCPRDWLDRAWWRLMGYDPEPGTPATAALLDAQPGAVLALGDLAYPEGSAEDFRRCYAPSWGRHKDRTYPVPGNHEYDSRDAEPYFDYWGARAGPRGKGYYSLDLGAWHVVALNSSIDVRAGAPQERWLRADLAATPARCILAFWHHPLFSSGRHGGALEMRPLYRALYEAGASVVLAGHDHDYERFAPQDPGGRFDPARGLRSFVVGTGGAPLRPRSDPAPNSELFHTGTFGVLRLTLYEDRYAWDFLPADGAGFTDRGEALCVERGKPSDP